MAASLNTDEINALMSAIQEGRITPEPSRHRAAAVPYDLTSQDRVIRGQMPTLDAINDQIASSLAIGLAGRTRLSLRVTNTPATLLKFQDFNSMLAPPATVCVLSLGKGNSQALLVMEPRMTESLLAAALGDKRARPDESSQEKRRELTVVERQVLKRLLSILTDAMTLAWAPVLPFKPEIVRFESDPRLAMIAPAGEAAVLCTFEISGGLTGLVQLALPYTALEPAKKALMSPPRLNQQSDTQFSTQLRDEIESVEVDMRALLGKTTLNFERLLDLNVGDILTLGTSEGVSLPIFVHGRPKLSGQPIVRGGGLAIHIERGPVSEIRRPFESDSDLKTTA